MGARDSDSNSGGPTNPKEKNYYLRELDIEKCFSLKKENRLFTKEREKTSGCSSEGLHLSVDENIAKNIKKFLNYKEKPIL